MQNIIVNVLNIFIFSFFIFFMNTRINDIIGSINNIFWPFIVAPPVNNQHPNVVNIPPIVVGERGHVLNINRNRPNLNRLYYKTFPENKRILGLILSNPLFE